VCRECDDSSGGNFKEGWGEFMLAKHYGELHNDREIVYKRAMLMMHFPGPSRMPYFQGKPGAWFASVEWSELPNNRVELWVDSRSQKVYRGGRLVWDGTEFSTIEEVWSEHYKLGQNK
jgi:hypothetical protein